MDSLNEHMILEAELMPLIRERLAAGQTILNLRFRGVSMLPMLRQGMDTVDLAPLPPRLKKYDLPVYQYPSGKFVMHRVVKTTDTHYICLGDNTYSYETIAPEQMIAVVSAFCRNGRRIRVDSAPYRLYCRLWCWSFPLRRFLRRCKHTLRRWLK